MAELGRQAFQHGQLFAAGMIGEIARDDFGEGVVTGKSRAENHAGIVPHGVGQSPALGQLRAFAGRLIAHDQRDAGVAQGVDSRGDRQASNPVEGCQVIGGNAEFTFQIESAAAAGQLDDILDIRDGLKGGLSLFALDQAPDVFVEHGVAELRRDGANELIAAQDALDIAIVEDVLGSGQAQRRSGDHHRG